MSIIRIEGFQRERPEIIRARLRWNSVCPGSDPVIERYAKEHRAQITPWVLGAPIKFIDWRDREARCEISLTTNLGEPSYLYISGAVSWGTEREKIVRVGMQELKLGGPVDPEMLQDALFLTDVAIQDITTNGTIRPIRS